MRVRALFLLAALVACGSSHRTSDAGDGSGSNGPHDLVGLSVNPTNPILEVDLNTTGMVPFVATANYADGTSEDVSAQTTWAVENPAVGSLVNSVLHTPAFATSTAVVSKINATYKNVAGIAQVTVVAYRLTGPQKDFFFVLPYNDPAGNQTKPLDFSTAVPGLDVFFNMDTTGSMGGEISALETAINSVVTPGIRMQVADSQFGVGSMQDFPLDGHGSEGCDEPFRLLQPITGDLAAVSAGVNALSNGFGSPIGCGDDLPESGIESIYQAATGDGLTGPAPTMVPPNHTGRGGVGFRNGTLPVIVSITDAISHGVGETATCFSDPVGYEPEFTAFAHTRAQTKGALNAICGRSVGIAPTGGGGCDGVEYLEYLATATGTRVPPNAWDLGGRPAGCAVGQCCTSYNGAGRAPDADGLCPLVFLVQTSGAGVTDSIVTGIQMLTRFATFTVPTEHEGVTTDVDGNPLPAPHTTDDFLRAIVPETYLLPPPPPLVPAPSFDTQEFFNVTPGTIVTFSVAAYNDFIMQTDKAQIFRATIRVTAGSSCTITLDQRDVLILVPPVPVEVQ